MKEFFTKHFEAFYLRLTGVNHTTLLIYEKLKTSFHPYTIKARYTLSSKSVKV